MDPYRGVDVSPGPVIGVVIGGKDVQAQPEVGGQALVGNGEPVLPAERDVGDVEIAGLRSEVGPGNLKLRGEMIIEAVDKADPADKALIGLVVEKVRVVIGREQEADLAGDANFPLDAVGHCRPRGHGDG